MHQCSQITQQLPIPLDVENAPLHQALGASITFKDIIVRRPYTFGITLVVVFLAGVALIFMIPSQAQVKSSVQLAIERGKNTAIANIETTVKRLSLVELDLVLLTLRITDPNLSAM